MKNTEEILKDLEKYTEKEIIYRNYWKVRNEPKKRIEYMKEIEEYVRQQHLLIFDFPFITYPEILSERDFYSRLSISKHSNVNVVRHLRYTPIFEHSHTFFTVLYVLKGQCDHTVAGENNPMKQGDVFFLPPYVKQTIGVFDNSLVLNIHIRRDTFDDYFFNILRSENKLSNFFISCLYSKNPTKGLMFHTGDDKNIRDLYLNLYQETLIDDEYSWRILDNITSILFSELLRGYSDKIELIGDIDPQEIDDPSLRLLSYINNNYRTATLQTVAEKFHYSIPYCSKMIKEKTGMGFVAFVRNVRMNHATALLKNTNRSIVEIGEDVGYENPESFIRAFKKMYEMTPSAYRREMKKNK